MPPPARPSLEGAELVFRDREPLARLLTTEVGQRRWSDTHGVFDGDPLLDPLWADAGFRAAMRARMVEACPLARPWSIPPRPGTRVYACAVRPGATKRLPQEPHRDHDAQPLDADRPGPPAGRPPPDARARAAGR